MPIVTKRIPEPEPRQYTFFWPILILMAGLALNTALEIRIFRHQRTAVIRGIESLEPKVEVAEYQKNKYYYIVSQLLRLAPANSNAKQVVDEFELRKLQDAQPELTSMTTPPAIPGPVAANSTNSFVDPSRFLENADTNAPSVPPVK